MATAVESADTPERTTCPVGKRLILGAVEDHGKAAGRIRLQFIPDFTIKTLTAFVEANVERGDTLKADGLKVCEALEQSHYRHFPRIQGSMNMAVKWLQGTCHGVEPKHVQSCSGEFVFRNNRRRATKATLKTLLGTGTHRGPTTDKGYHRSVMTGQVE